MDNRTRFLKTLRFETVDHPPLLNSGPWGSTLERWHREGLPEGVSLDQYFGIEPVRFAGSGVETLFVPTFEERILEDKGDYVIKINNQGIKERNFRNGGSMPEFLEYPIKSADDLPWLLERLNPATPGRIRPDWLATAKQRRSEGAILFSNGGMYFAFLNEHMGTEALLYTYFDRPDFIHAVNDRLCRLCEFAMETVLPSFPLDYIGYHEDMAFKNGPLISPDLFREFMTPYYRRIQKLGHTVDIHYMDSDGDIRQLIPLWLECGINVFAPLEVAAGMDVVALRKEYGKAVRMIGGFDKRILASTPDRVRKELERIRPVIEGGGYIPGCDHGVPPDVPFENYRCFINTLKAMYGVK